MSSSCPPAIFHSKHGVMRLVKQMNQWEFRSENSGNEGWSRCRRDLGPVTARKRWVFDALRPLEPLVPVVCLHCVLCRFFTSNEECGRVILARSLDEPVAFFVVAFAEGRVALLTAIAVGGTSDRRAVTRDRYIASDRSSDRLRRSVLTRPLRVMAVTWCQSVG